MAQQEAGSGTASQVAGDQRADGETPFASAPGAQHDRRYDLQSGVLVGDMATGWNGCAAQREGRGHRSPVQGGDRRWLGAASSSRLLPHGPFRNRANAAKAFKWFKRAADNNQACNTDVGYCYANGKGVKRNWNRALMYYEKGTALGESVCCFELGTFFERGLMGLDVDKAEARRYYHSDICELLRCR